MKQIILTFLSIAVLGSPAAAEGLKAKQVPANAQWIAHVDIDGFKTSKLGKFTLGRLKDVAAPIDAVAAMLQFDPRKDLSDITAYGNHSKADQPENAAVLLNGRFKPDHLMTLLKAGEGLKVEKAGKHQLLEWTKDKETEYGSIVNEKLLVLGTNRKMVAQALKTVDGKVDTLNAKKLKDLKLDKGAYIMLGMASLEGLPIPPEAKILENVKSIGVTLGEKGDNLEAGVSLYAANAEFAEQIQQMLQGLLALVQLQAGNATEPQAREAAEFLKGAKLVQEGQLVRLTLAVPVDSIIEKAKLQFEAEAKNGGKNGSFKFNLGIESGDPKNKKK
tara:strand:+ start:516 stop:1511 length:996 start_codon:yes stop_codon:yes gene_type:complete